MTGFMYEQLWDWTASDELDSCLNRGPRKVMLALHVKWLRVAKAISNRKKSVQISSLFCRQCHPANFLQPFQLVNQSSSNHNMYIFHLQEPSTVSWAI